MHNRHIAVHKRCFWCSTGARPCQLGWVCDIFPSLLAALQVDMYTHVLFLSSLFDFFLERRPRNRSRAIWPRRGVALYVLKKSYRKRPTSTPPCRAYMFSYFVRGGTTVACPAASLPPRDRLSTLDLVFSLGGYHRDKFLGIWHTPIPPVDTPNWRQTHTATPRVDIIPTLCFMLA